MCGENGPIEMDIERKAKEEMISEHNANGAADAEQISYGTVVSSSLLGLVATVVSIPASPGGVASSFSCAATMSSVTSVTAAQPLRSTEKTKPFDLNSTSKLMLWLSIDCVSRFATQHINDGQLACNCRSVNCIFT